MGMFARPDGTPVTKISWNAPTVNTDGSAVTDALTYNLYIDAVNMLSFPGSLNTEGKYEFPLADVPAIESPNTYAFELTAVDAGGDESGKSNAIDIVRVETVPNAPSGLAAG